MNLTICYFQSIHVTQEIKQTMGIMEHYDSIICDELSVISQQKPSNKVILGLDVFQA